MGLFYKLCRVSLCDGDDEEEECFLVAIPRKRNASAASGRTRNLSSLDDTFFLFFEGETPTISFQTPSS